MSHAVGLPPYVALFVAILALGSPPPALAGVAAYSPDLEGAAQVLLEAGIQFDIVDERADLGDR